MNKYKSNSRENQDLFILSVLNKKINGTYLEIGSQTPIEDSNTYLLESEFNWTGISLEIRQDFVEQFNFTRKNICIQADATEIDYSKVLYEYNLDKHIDYLQLDIDPPNNTFKALNKIDFDVYSFSIITYEHDYYRGGELEREESRKILNKYGYTLVIKDVMHAGLIFEDWYINEKYMTNDNWKYFLGEEINMNTANMNPYYINLFNNLL
jgi:hypothetical protein